MRNGHKRLALYHGKERAALVGTACHWDLGSDPNITDKAVVCHGTVADKALIRANFLADCLEGFSYATPNRAILLIGYVGAFVEIFAGRGFPVYVSDLDYSDKNWSNKKATFVSSSKLATIIPKMGVVVATGMTLWNNTLDSLLHACKNTNVPLVLFAETGASLCPLMIKHGVQAVLSEPFPFYVFGGSTELRYYTRPWCAASTPLI